MAVFLFNTVIYVFLLSRILIVCLCIFIVPAGTLWLRDWSFSVLFPLL